jgi:hypothetical protein
MRQELATSIGVGDNRPLRVSKCCSLWPKALRRVTSAMRQNWSSERPALRNLLTSRP